LPETVAAASIASALVQGTASLAAAGCDTPRLDAELLLGSALGATRSRLVMDATSVLDRDRLESFQALLARRAAREPIAYILGVKEFRRISLAVDRRVLIPRPETELLVEVGLTLERGAQVVDVGTGSGAVALALKDERPDLSVVGTDISADALVLARENASALGLDVLFVEADLLGGGLTCDAVLANLPYVAEDGSPLPPEIARYEPAAALFGGPDGLDPVRRLVEMLAGVSFVALEVGFDQAPAVAALLELAGFGALESRRDLAGHERVVLGRR
jgi:release factor glutamine methyltransferase